MRMESSGGGGHGDPLLRDPDRVQRDVMLGYISTAQAEARYGVVLQDTGAVDEAATNDKRADLAAARITATAQLANDIDETGMQRDIPLPENFAHRLGVGVGDLVELTTPASGAALRGWASIGAQAEQLRLGPGALAVLGARPGDTIEIRSVPRTPA